MDLLVRVVKSTRTILNSGLPRVCWEPRFPACVATRLFLANGRLRCANRPYIKAVIACFEPLPLSIFRTANRHLCRGSLLISTDFTETSHNLIFPSQIPRIFCPLINGPGLPQGGEGPTRGEQEDKILDQIRVGRGLDTGGELLGRQRAGGADAPWHGWRPAGADSRQGGTPDGGPFPAAGCSAIGCCRAQHLRAGIGGCLSGPGR